MRTTAGRHAQHGQALILGLLVLVMSGGMLYYLFNTGQLLREKTTATNAADAAAISGGSVMARVMNFEAYTNRAVMANAVAIGQLTALASWHQNVLALGDNYDNQTPSSGSIGMFCLTQSGLTPLPCTYAGNAILEYYTGVDVFDYYETYLDPVMEVGTQAGAAAADTAMHMYLQTPIVKDVLLITMPIARRSAIQAAVDRNYEGFGPADASSVLVEDTFFSFNGAASPMIRRHTGDDRERLRAVVQTSAFADPFVRERRFTRTTLIPTCIGANGIRFDNLRRGGGTRVGLEDWEAVDTSSWHESYLRKGRCRNRENPLGHGQAESGGDEGLSNGDLGGSGQNPGAVSASDDYASSLSYSGLPSFYELSRAALDTDRPRARFAVRVNRDQADMRVVNRAAQARAGGRFDLMGAPGGRTMAALSSAEVFFERLSDRSDGREELASLFNPFWHVRLTTPGLPAIAETAAAQ